MSREWKPGDVILDPDQQGAARVAVVVSPHFSGCPSPHREYGVHVHYGDGDWNALKDRFLPLVVIDPEEIVHVDQMIATLRNNGWTTVADAIWLVERDDFEVVSA